MTMALRNSVAEDMVNWLDSEDNLKQVYRHSLTRSSCQFSTQTDFCSGWRDAVVL